MEALSHQRDFDEEVARLAGQTGYRCPRCSYDLGRLEDPRCPECGRAVTLRDLGEYGTTAETETALRLHGPVGCGACGERIYESVNAACPACHTRIKLSWFAVYARGPRRLRTGMQMAVMLGGSGIVAGVVPVTLFLIAVRIDLIVLLVAMFAAWVVWVVRIRRGLAAPRPVLVGFGPWASIVLCVLFGVAS